MSNQEINGFKIVEIDGDDGNLIAYHVIGEGVFERFTDYKLAMNFIERSDYNESYFKGRNAR